MKTVGVINAGAWGTALAQVTALAGLAPRLWCRRPEAAAHINVARENARHLPGVRLHDAIEATDDLASLGDCDLVLAVAPAVLSGPSFAAEVARGLPTAVTLACPDEALGRDLLQALAAPAFRPYLSDDLIGAEAAGAVKNVLAIGCGIVEGRGLGRSAHAALITRGFAELARFAVALGGRAETVAGLCGFGDLVLTCSSSQSRNNSVGLALGQGRTLDETLAGKLSVAEGVASAPAVTALARKLGVEMPICEAVAAILEGRIDIDSAIEGLLSRPLKTEL